MALRIIKATEVIRVERLNVVIYAQPGIGKSSMAFTAEAPLMLDFDQGSHRAINRKDVVRVSAWPEVVDIGAEDLASYKTVIVDTAGRALDVLTTDILKRNPKAGSGGALSLKGFGQLKTEFVSWIKMVNTFGLDVVLVLHMDESRKGDELIERLDLTGGSKLEIYKAADAMGRIQMIDGKRILNFNPSDTAFGKNPGQLDPLPVPHPDKDPTFLADVIASIKTRLNAMTAEQTAAVNLVAEWREKVQTFHTLQAFNRELATVKLQPRAVQSMFATAAAVAGYVFDKATAQYVSAIPTEKPGAEPPAETAKPSFGDLAAPVVQEEQETLL